MTGPDVPPTAAPAAASAPVAERSPYRWAWYLPGLLAIGWGGWGLLTAARGPEPLSFAVFVAILIIGHDLVLAPVAVAVGWVLGRWAPAVLRAPLQVGLFGTAVLVLAATPYLSGRGRSADNPSALPFDYSARVLVLLAVFWAGLLGWLLIRLLRSRAGRPADGQE